MPIIEHRTQVRTTQDAAFHAAQDYGIRAQWDPFFAGLAVIPAGDGPRRTKVTAWHRASMDVEFVA
ncbi:hypothetical protein [Chitinimonas naiadis]